MANMRSEVFIAPTDQPIPGWGCNFAYAATKKIAPSTTRPAISQYLRCLLVDTLKIMTREGERYLLG